jgi:anaerobic selenocysteine-containing dehydrogenase
MATELRTVCTRDCPDSCSVIATVEDGRITAHRGDPNHEVTRGFLCWRGNNYLRRFYHTDRLLHPRRRTKGSWQRLDWDDALDLIADKLQHYRDRFGPRSILVINYSGILTSVAETVAEVFWSNVGEAGTAGGVTVARGGLSSEPASAAQELDFGGDCTHEAEDLVNSGAFVLWGKNVAVTRPHWIPFMKQARERGAPLIVIDPLVSATARMADRFFQIRPGSDGMLAIGVARLLLERGAVDEDFIANHTSGFEAYRRLVMSHSVDAAAAAADLSRSQVEEIADLYASANPIATMIGLGICYWRNGGASVRLIDALAAISGNVGVPGGGSSTDVDRAPGFDRSMLETAPAVAGRQVLLPRIGDEILAARDPQLKLGWVAGANPAASVPDTNRAIAGLRSLEFLVVVEQFMTATAELADLVLPCTTYLEMDDIMVAYGHNWVDICRQVVPPRGEARCDREILQLLAQRLGFGAALAGSAEDWMRRLLAPLAEAGLTLEALKERAQRNPQGAPVPFADRRFPTASGRFTFVDRFEAASDRLGDRELHLVATKTLKMSSMQMEPEDLPAEPIAGLHPDTLAALDVAPGDLVLVESRVGRVRARAVADAKLRGDVLLINPSLWQGDLCGVNQLREAFVTDLGDTAALHETRVTLRPADR